MLLNDLHKNHRKILENLALKAKSFHGMPLLRQRGLQAGLQADRQRDSDRAQADLRNYPNVCMYVHPEAADLCNCPKKLKKPNSGQGSSRLRMKARTSGEPTRMQKPKKTFKKPIIFSAGTSKYQKKTAQNH